MAKGIRRLLERLDGVVGCVDKELLIFYGGAQVDPVGEQPKRSDNRLDGVAGDYVVKRGSAGHTYLAPKPGHDGR